MSIYFDFSKVLVVQMSCSLHCIIVISFLFNLQSKPWKSILTSRPVWAILVANAAGNYGAYMLLTQMPTYLKEVLKFDIKSVGFFFMVVLCSSIKIAIYTCNNGPLLRCLIIL